jgi:putative transposase
LPESSSSLEPGWSVSGLIRSTHVRDLFPFLLIGSPISDTRMKASFRQNLLPKEGGFAVKRKRFSVEQIVAVLKQSEVGAPVAELIRQVGITEQTLYRWKKQYKGLETDQVRQFKQLQEENGRLKRLVAGLTLDKVMLQDVLAKVCNAPAAPLGGELLARDLPGERAACLSCGADRGLDLPL